MVLRRRYPPCPFPYTSAPLHASHSSAAFRRPRAMAIGGWSDACMPGSPWPITRAFRKSPRGSAWASKPYATTGNALLLQGTSSLEDKRSPGRPSKLTKSQRRELADLLKAAPQAAGATSGGWHTPMLQDRIHSRFGGA
jgi:hypothetical protein